MPVGPPLPRPTVEVTDSPDGKTHVVISRDGKSKSWEVAGSTGKEMVKDAVEKIISDPYSAEWLPLRDQRA